MVRAKKIMFTAEADPTVLSRVAALLCTHGAVPAELIVVRRLPDVLRFSICLPSASSRELDLIQRKLVRLPQFIDIALMEG